MGLKSLTYLFPPNLVNHTSSFDSCPGMLDNIETLPMETQLLEEHAKELGHIKDPGGLPDEGYPKYFGNPVHSVTSSPDASPTKIMKTEETKTETSNTPIKHGPEETTKSTKKDAPWSTTMNKFHICFYMFEVWIYKKLVHATLQSHQA